MPSILIADKIDERGINCLREISEFEVNVQLGASEAELCHSINRYQAVIVRSATMITRPVIHAGTNLKVIGRAGIGTDNIDIEAATEHGIVVLNTPDANAITTAELTLAHLLSLSRHLPHADRSVRTGEWERSRYLGTEIAGKTLGIIGLGTIGRILAARCQGMNMHVTAHDPFVSQEIYESLGIESLELEDLLERSDYVSLHCPVTARTRNLLDAERIARMKPGARLINCARGELVDEQALHDALLSGSLSGAALDVFANEPPVNSPLLDLKNIVFTPHLGASTQEAQAAVGIEIAKQVATCLQTGEAVNAVNIISIPQETLATLRPYLELAEKLGSVLANLIEHAPQSLEVTVCDRSTDVDVRPVTVGTLIGLLKNTLSVPVNQVNARHLAERQGISLIEAHSDQPQEYLCTLQLCAKNQDDAVTVVGTVLADGKPRLIRINEYEIDAVPEGTLLITWHDDRPGVVGELGTILGQHHINICRMQIGTAEQNSLAIGVLEISPQPDSKAIQALEQISAIHKIRLLNL